jgi:hypothetical protein
MSYFRREECLWVLLNTIVGTCHWDLNLFEEVSRVHDLGWLNLIVSTRTFRDCALKLLRSQSLRALQFLLLRSITLVIAHLYEAGG